MLTVMDGITQRLRLAEEQFEAKRAQREEYLQHAQDCLDEMNRLQGEYRVLQDLLKEQSNTDRADTIEVVPDQEENTVNGSNWTRRTTRPSH